MDTLIPERNPFERLTTGSRNAWRKTIKDFRQNPTPENLKRIEQAADVLNDYREAQGLTRL